MSDQPESPHPSGQPAAIQPVVQPSRVPGQPDHLIYETEDAFDAAFGQWREAPDGSSYWNDWPLDIDPTIEIERVWTVVDGDSGAQWALPGGHLVNRVAYIVTEKPWPHTSIDGMVWDVPDDDA
jgi:hypothetical protein